MKSTEAESVMRALLVRQQGWPNEMKIEQYSIPSIEAESVLVKVFAAGLNFADSLIIGGTYQEKPALPFIPGSELVGQVVACGSQVDGLSVGDRVMGQVPAGAFAEYVAIHKDRLICVPRTMSNSDAAGFYIPYGTAMCAVRERGRLKAGETLLVLGAAGAVGLAAVQVGKAMGAKVIGVSRNPLKKQAVLDAGADGFVAYQGGNLKAALEEAAGCKSVDVVLDVVGGETTQQALRCLDFEGRLVILGFTSGDAPLLKSNHILVKNIDIVGCYWGPYQTRRPDDTRSAFGDVLDWYEQGLIKPQVAATVTLTQVGDALGKLVGGAYAEKWSSISARKARHDREISWN